MMSFLFFMFFLLKFYVVCGSEEEKVVAINDAYAMITTTPQGQDHLSCKEQFVQQK